MPNFDQSGPQGKGPRSGRGRGKCDPQNPSEDSHMLGRGMGRKRGVRRGPQTRAK